MGIKQFELFHGAVLTKLVRGDRPVTLRMIETHPSEAWAIYTINDQVDLLIKHCTSGRDLARDEGATSWQFVFSPDQVVQLRERANVRQVCAALVCARSALRQADMHICLLDPVQLAALIDLHDLSTQSITVKYIPRKMLRVYSGHRVEMLVSQSALEQWQVPGS